MARLALGQVGVHEVQVAGQGGVDEGGAIRRGAAPADERRGGGAAEVVHKSADGTDRWGVEGADRDSEGVEDADLELLDRFRAEVRVLGPRDEVGEALYLGGVVHRGSSRLGEGSRAHLA